MANEKRYGLIGVGPNIQFGRKGGGIRYIEDAPDVSSTNPAFQARNSTNDGLLRFQVGTPTHYTDAATKLYVDNLVQGLTIKAPVRLTSTENVPLTGTTTGTLVDGVQIANGNRILLKNQDDATENGIYDVTTSSGNYTLVRSADANNSDGATNPASEVKGGMFTFVTEGDTFADTGWVMSSPNGVAVLGTDDLVFVQFSAAGVVLAGNGLTKTGNVFDVNVNDTTIYINEGNQIGIKSSGIAGQTIISGLSGDAVWGSLDLSNSVGNSILPEANGGTGKSTYATGDILVGGPTANTLIKLTKGANNTVLGVDGTGSVTYRYLSQIRDVNGALVVDTTATNSATDYMTIKNATDGNVELGTDGTSSSVNLVFHAKGNGLLLGYTGYDEYLQENEGSIPVEAFTTKGYVDYKVDAIDTTRIQNAATTTFFDTDLSGFDEKATIGSRGKVVAEFEGAESGATAGERFTVTHITDEVIIGTASNSGLEDIDLRLVPQNQGQVFIGSAGSGLIQSEETYDLTVKGGNSLDENAGDLILAGGDGETGNYNGGDVIIRGGVASGTGTRGVTIIQDTEQNPIAKFSQPTTSSSNSFEFVSAVNDSDPLISGVKLKGIGSGDVSIILDPQGNGLVRVADSATYLSELNSSGQDDALVTKEFVVAQVGGSVKTAGTGLTDNDNTFDVNIDATTIKVDGSDNLIVASTSTQYQTLISTGVSGQEATWGALPLGQANAISGTLGASNGGTGQTTYTLGDLLVGNGSGGLSKTSKGANNTFLGVNNSGTVAYNYVSNLRDANGLTLIAGTGVTNSVNNLTVKNAALNGVVEIGTEGTNTNVGILLSPKGNELVYAKAGYTANIGSNVETFVTKGYVDDALQFNTDSLMRRQVITSGWDSVMNIGSVTPNVSGRNVYIHKVTFDVITPISGGSTALARVVAGANELMNVDENDTTIAGTYISEIPFNVTSNNTQVTVEFYQANGSTAATPTSGSVTITVEYKIL